jgi:hypothetical protein
MDLKKGFIGGFLVLGFVIFIVGFMTGMLTISLISAETDFTTTFMLFVLGFITGMLTIALVLVIMKLTELTRESS